MKKGSSCLLTQAKNGDQGAFAALLAQYSPLIEGQIAHLRASAPSCSNEDAQDIRQEAYLAFYRALITFDDAQDEVKFGLYAKICIENALISVWRRMRPAYEPLDSELLDSLPALDGGDDPTRRLREEEDFRTLYRVVEQVLSPYENTVWQCYVAGMTAAEIAKLQGREMRSVHNAIYRIRHKLRTALSKADTNGQA